MRLARHVENEDTWQRCVEVETQRHQDTGAPRALAKVQVKVQAKVKAKARNEHLKHVCAVERKDTRQQIAHSVGKERTAVASTPSLAELYRFAMNFLSMRKKRKRNRDGRKRRR